MVSDPRPKPASGRFTSHRWRSPLHPHPLLGVHGLLPRRFALDAFGLIGDTCPFAATCYASMSPKSGLCVSSGVFQASPRTLEKCCRRGRPCWPPPSTGRLPGSACACKRDRSRTHRALGHAAEPQAIASEFESTGRHQVSSGGTRRRASDVVRECRETLSSLSLM